jgi:signal transduction histidine kinase
LSNTQKGDCFELIDDGIPFDFMTAYRYAKGTGLKNIQSRLQSIAAQFEQKNIEKGNHYIISLSD